MPPTKEITTFITPRTLFTFIAIALFYLFETAQMSYFNVLAPTYLHLGIYHHGQIASLSAAYYYGDMLGLLPVGIALDRLPLRKTLLWAIVGSVLSAFVLLLSYDFYLQWGARFFCGFFGGTFSFIGGIHILTLFFQKRFTLFMGIFIAAGMLGALLCQYPLLIAVEHWGIEGPMRVMFLFGIVVTIFNLFFLQPLESHTEKNLISAYSGTILQMCLEIISNFRNWLDCIIIVFLEIPNSVIGTLWGLVLLINFYHFSSNISAFIIMSFYAGTIIGLPLWGEIADRYQHRAWIIVLGAGGSFLAGLSLFIFRHYLTVFSVALLFFALGFLSSCQTLGFTWLTQDMRPELIGRNSAFNSIIFMAAGGGFKQLGAYLLSIPILIGNGATAGNLLLLTTITMLITTFYAMGRKKLFSYIK